MKTILLTRYNLPASFQSGRAIDASSEDWLEHRTSIFNRLCLPSVKNQSSSKFTWYIGYAKSTPSKFIKNLPDFAEPIFANSVNEYIKIVRNKVCHSNKLLSLRLDNDDTIDKFYIETFRKFARACLKNAASMRMPIVLRYPNGLNHDITTDIFYKYRYPGCSFLALLENKNATEQSVEKEYKLSINYNHATIHKHFPCISIQTGRPMWLINVHSNNVGNTLKDNHQVDNSVNLKNFGIL